MVVFNHVVTIVAALVVLVFAVALGVAMQPTLAVVQPSGFSTPASGAPWIARRRG